MLILFLLFLFHMKWHILEDTIDQELIDVALIEDTIDTIKYYIYFYFSTDILL